MVHLSLSLLGGFNASLDDQPASGFDSNKVRALLAYLAVEADHPHRRESLAAMLWPESPARSARTNLRNALANLRKVLRDDNPDQPYILVSHDTLQFNRVSNAEIDVGTFNALVNIENPNTQQLEKAVGIYQGSFLQGFSLTDSLAFDDWTLIMRERLHRRALKALRDLSSHYAQLGDYIQACEFSRKQVEMEPWREEAHRDLMRLLVISGQRGAALKQYEICRQVLDAELGVTPSRETKLLYAKIRDGTIIIPSTPVTVSQPISPHPRHNLPTQLTPFVGRKEELVAIGKRLEDPACRLLTLVGPGGSGKTRLAIEVGFQSVDRFEHGVFLVSLASLESVDSIISSLADALNYTFFAGVDPRKQILNFLLQKNLLLIFDNFEHLLPPSVDQSDEENEHTSTFILDILKSAPDVKLKVTSRTRLNVQGEMLFPVSGMAVPESVAEATTGISTPRVLEFAQYSAVELFVLSARRVNPDFELTTDNQVDVVRICHLVNGMPLGILLAAGWAHVLSPSEIVAQIEESFDFLETEMRDIPERQRSMRSVFNHTWRLLSTREREILLATSIFRGKTKRTAIQAVAGATLRELRSLSDKSLLHINTNGYYEVHELVRQYAAEKLDLDIGDRMRERHSVYYTTALGQWGEEMKGPHQETAFYRVSSELENIRIAWFWTLNHGRIRRIGQAHLGLIYYFIVHRHLQEGERWFRMTLKRVEEIIALKEIEENILTKQYTSPLPLDFYDKYNYEELTVERIEEFRILALILANHAYIDFWTWGHSERVQQNAEKARALVNHLALVNQDIRMEKAAVLFFTSDLNRHTRLDENIQALTLYRELGDEYWTAMALWQLGWTYWIFGNFNESKRTWQQGLALSRKQGAPLLILTLLGALGNAAWDTGEYNLAEQISEETLERTQKLTKKSGVELALQAMANIALLRGQLDGAKHYAKACIKISKEFPYPFHTEVGLRRLGKVLMASGQFKVAHKALSDSLEISREIAQQYEISSSLVRLSSSLLHLGQYEQALHQMQECLSLARELGAQRNISFCHLVQGRLSLVNGEFQESITFLQQGIAILEGMGSRRELGPAYADLCLGSLRLGKVTQAKQYLKTALQYAVKTGDFVAHVYVIPVAALFFAIQGQPEKATGLYTLASGYPMVANSRWFRDVLYFDSIAMLSIADKVDIPQSDGQWNALKKEVTELLTKLD